MATITRKISKNLRKDISRKINVVPLGYLDRNSHGDILSRITNDVDTISHSLDSSIVTVASSIIMLVGSLTIMFVKSWILTLSAISASFIGFALSIIIMKFSRKHFIAQQKALGELNGHIEETYTGHNIVKAYNAEEKSIETFNQTNNILYKSAWKSQFLGSLMMPIMSFIGNLGFVIVCIIALEDSE